MPRDGSSKGRSGSKSRGSNTGRGGGKGAPKGRPKAASKSRGSSSTSAKPTAKSTVKRKPAVTGKAKTNTQTRAKSPARRNPTESVVTSDDLADGSPTAIDPVTEKLQKVLADAGLGSRRQMEKAITDGRVTVNKEPAHLGQRVGARDEIRIDGGKPIRQQVTKSRVLLLNKAEGVICSRKDAGNRPTVFRGLPRLRQGRWISVGRLDINSTGLLLICNDGALANKLMHPSTGLDREYAVRVDGLLEADAISALCAGVEIDGERHAFSDLRYFNGSGRNHWYHAVLLEGKNREVRRLFESLGYMVSRLKRVRYGPVVMPHSLARGRMMEMSTADVRALYKLVGLQSSLPRVSKTVQVRERKAESVLLPYPELPGAEAD